jgi:tetratricopeptide (TPR) repeat protein
MEILKKLIFFIVLSLAMASISLAQTNDDPVKDFRGSYQYEDSGDYANAIKVLTTSYKSDSYEYNARLGWLHYMAGSFTESVTYYQIAINLKPFALEPRFGIAYPLAELGNWNLVIAQYQKILEIDPMNTTASYRLGYIYYSSAEYEKASGLFEKVVNLYPFDFDSVLMYAWSNYKMGKLREAKILFQKALMIEPDNASAKEGLDLIK